LEKAQVDLLASAAAEVRTSLKTYSEENGWKVVLLASEGAVGRGGLQETQLQLGMQTVLYTADGHDITASFIAWLNARNAAAAAAPAGP
jgi:Skp family chaperone for outer membrane proteins